MWQLGEPARHLQRAPWQMRMWHEDRHRFDAGLRAEIEMGEIVRQIGLALGADGFLADSLVPERPRVHGVGQLREANVDYLLVFGRQIILLDGKSLSPGRYTIRRPTAHAFPTGEAWRLRAQVTDGEFFDTLEAPGRVPSQPARALQSQARELTLAADAAGVDVRIETVLVVSTDLARIEAPDSADPERPWVTSHFAFPDGRPLTIGSPLTTTPTRLEGVLLRAAAMFDAPVPEIRSWLEWMLADSERRRLARIEREIASGVASLATVGREWA